MISFIEQIFQEYKYLLKEKSSNNDLFFGEEWEYFLVSEYTNKGEDKIQNFFESEKTNNLITFFDNQKGKSSDIEKNTSLIILLKVKNLKEDFKVLKNQIMKIEEDEYFFRKYIIVYDEIWEKNINNIDELNKSLNDIDLEKFRECNYENSKWFLIIQLFIKLPFLKVETKELELEDLLETINKEIKEKKLEKLNDFILSKGYLLKWQSEEDFFDELKEKFLNPNSKDIDDFLDMITK